VGDLLLMAYIQQVRVGRDEWTPQRAGNLSSHAISHADSPSRAMIMPSSKPPRSHTQIWIDRMSVQYAELCDVQHRRLLVDANHPNQMVDDLGYANSRQRRFAGLQHRLDHIRCRFGAQKRDHRIGVKDAHRPRSRSADRD